MQVYRHLIDGDMLLVNRQPTLHKPGIMAHKARYFTDTLYTHAYCGKLAHIFLTTLLSTADIMNMHYFRWCYCILYNTVVCVFYAYMYTIYCAHFIYMITSYIYIMQYYVYHTESSGMWPRRPSAWAMPTATRTMPTSMEMRWTATSYRYILYIHLVYVHVYMSIYVAPIWMSESCECW